MDLDEVGAVIDGGASRVGEIEFGRVDEVRCIIKRSENGIGRSANDSPLSMNVT
jgi:hypothetical protein